MKGFCCWQGILQGTQPSGRPWHGLAVTCLSRSGETRRLGNAGVLPQTHLMQTLVAALHLYRIRLPMLSIRCWLGTCMCFAWKFMLAFHAASIERVVGDSSGSDFARGRQRTQKNFVTLYPSFTPANVQKSHAMSPFHCKFLYILLRMGESAIIPVNNTKTQSVMIPTGDPFSSRTQVCTCSPV